jgi:AraC family transcriptional regulator, transcriptional activator of pobA
MSLVPDPLVIDTAVLNNKLTGDIDLRIEKLNGLCFQKVSRNRYSAVIWVQQGYGRVKYEFNEYAFSAPCLIFFAPYQPFVFTEAENISVVRIHFSNDFFCVEKLRKEVACNGILFNNIYNNPLVTVSNECEKEYTSILNKMKIELQRPDADRELLFSCLKIFLIHATRVKKADIESHAGNGLEVQQHTLRQLKDLVEKNFSHHRNPGFYAGLLNITPKALGKLVKKYFNKTLTDLIHERVLIEAKRELYLTEKAIKVIASELGFEDPLYFSRWFKKHTNISPEMYRETLQLDRGN